MVFFCPILSAALLFNENIFSKLIYDPIHAIYYEVFVYQLYHRAVCV